MSWKDEIRKKDKVNTAKRTRTIPVEFDKDLRPKKRKLTPEEKRMKELGYEYQGYWTGGKKWLGKAS